jgi:hypothetical protein
MREKLGDTPGKRVTALHVLSAGVSPNFSPMGN